MNILVVEFNKKIGFLNYDICSDCFSKGLQLRTANIFSSLAETVESRVGTVARRIAIIESIDNLSQRIHNSFGRLNVRSLRVFH